jgi:hypothetical protein
MHSTAALRDTMKAFTTMTLFIIVILGIITFIFISTNIFMNMTYSADVVAENLEYLNIIDTAHILKACLEGSNGIITKDEVEGFSKLSCTNSFPGLGKIDYEYRIEDREDSSLFKQSPGYDTGSTKPAHAIFINIVMDDGEVHVGRLNAQKR